MLELLLNFHVFVGALVLALGLAQIVMPKRGKRHRAIGKVYVILMILTASSAISISVFRLTEGMNFGALFLLVIGIFSLYLSVSGYIFAHFRESIQQSAGKWIAIPGMLAGFALFVLGAILFLNGDRQLYVLCLAFGLIQGALSIQDYRFRLRSEEARTRGKKSWLAAHIGRMIGSYIAAVTAFLVNAVEGGPMILKWLLPTLLGQFLIVFFIRKFTSV